MIYHNQAKYYEALQQSHNQGGEVDCRPFIDFMLNVIESYMYQYVDNSDNPLKDANGGLNLTEKEIIALIKENSQIKSFEIAQKLMKPIRTIDNNIRQLKEKGIIVRVGSKKNRVLVN
jgi:predicted HTH transcriptional regulator